MPKTGKDTKPTIVRIKNKTIVGTGCLIDQAEMLKDIICYGLWVIGWFGKKWRHNLATSNQKHICVHQRLSAVICGKKSQISKNLLLVIGHQ